MIDLIALGIVLFVVINGPNGDLSNDRSRSSEINIHQLSSNINCARGCENMVECKNIYSRTKGTVRPVPVAVKRTCGSDQPSDKITRIETPGTPETVS